MDGAGGTDQLKAECHYGPVVAAQMNI